MDRHQPASLSLFLLLLLSCQLQDVKTDGQVKNLACYNDYEQEMVCTWEVENLTINCRDQYLLKYESSFKFSLNNTCIPENLTGGDFISFSKCSCTIAVLYFVAADEYTIELLYNETVLLNDTVIPMNTVKPKAPRNLTVKKIENGNFILSWDKSYQESSFLHNKLSFEVTYYNKRNANKNHIKRHNQLDTYYEILTSELDAGDHVAKVRSLPNGYQGQWSEWSSEVQWHKKSELSLPILQINVLIFSIVTMALIVLSYVCCITHKRKWWNNIPDPAKSSFAVRIFSKSQVISTPSEPMNQHISIKDRDRFQQAFICHVVTWALITSLIFGTWKVYYWRVQVVTQPELHLPKRLADAIEPPQNIWTYLARKVLNISNFCLSDMRNPVDLLTTCLIAIPTPARVLLYYFKATQNDSWANEEDIRTHPMLYEYCRDCPTNFNFWDNMTQIITHNIAPGDVCYNMTCNPDEIPKCQQLKMQQEIAKDIDIILLCDATRKCRNVTNTMNCNNTIVQASYGRNVKLPIGWLLSCGNHTSVALQELFIDLSSTRKAVLQNRVAIDYLLLKHNYGCEHFEGMCCFNLTDHATSIQSHIQALQELAKDIKQDINVNWWDWVFGWLPSMGSLRQIIGGIIICICLLIMICCFIQCIPSFITIFHPPKVPTMLPVSYRHNQ